MLDEYFKLLFILFTFGVIFITVFLLFNIPIITKFIMKDRRKYDVEIYKNVNGRSYLVESYDNVKLENIK